VTPHEIVAFWLDVGEKRWFAVDSKLDAEIGKRFERMWRKARDGELSEWEASAEGTLALLLLLDQFPRNMFRGKAQAFSTDKQARRLAQQALTRGYDLIFPAALRAFFYMPFMHSENLADQDACVKLVAERLGTSSPNYPFALGHRDTIRRFGRFPLRNAALGRRSTEAEKTLVSRPPRINRALTPSEPDSRS
jgi:uncharacterized protein (DUF924 family)